MLVMNHCSMAGSVSTADLPSERLLVGTGRQVRLTWPSEVATRSQMSLTFWRTSSSWGRNTWPAAYAPRGGSFRPCSSISTAWKKPSGMPTRIPAPSPARTVKVGRVRRKAVLTRGNSVASKPCMRYIFILWSY